MGSTNPEFLTDIVITFGIAGDDEETIIDPQIYQCRMQACYMSNRSNQVFDSAIENNTVCDYNGQEYLNLNIWFNDTLPTASSWCTKAELLIQPMTPDGAYFSIYDNDNDNVDSTYNYVVQFDPNDIYQDENTKYNATVNFPDDQNLSYGSLAEVMSKYPTNIHLRLTYEDEMIGAKTYQVSILNKYSLEHVI